MKNKKDLKTKIEAYVINEVRKLREEQDWSQAELAHRLDVTPGFIGKIESCNSPSKYNLNHINALAEIFKCSPKDFLPSKKL